MQFRDPFLLAVRLALPLSVATGVLSGQEPVFRAAANFVHTNVIARDGKGRFVTGLTARDFVVYEDGVRQTIGMFRPFVGGRDMSVAAPPRNSGGLILPAPKASLDTSGRIFIVFIDDLSFQGKNTMMVRRVMDMLKKVIHDEDRVGFVSSGYSDIAVNLVHDYGFTHLDEAMGRTMGSGMTSREVITAASTSEGPAGLQYMAHTAMKVANDILDKLALVSDARKSFIYISEGYDFDPYKDSRLAAEQDRYGAPSGGDVQNPFLKNGQVFAESDLVADLAELIRNANRANVSFYAIDPRGLEAGPGIEETISMKEHRDHYIASVDTLKSIAAGTGGLCVCGTNDFKGGMAAIDRDTSDYYLIGYNSTNADPRKLRRLIRIETSKPGVTLTYGTEYAFKR